jgi:hypothetical protein
VYIFGRPVLIPEIRAPVFAKGANSNRKMQNNFKLPLSMVFTVGVLWNCYYLSPRRAGSDSG